MMSNISISLLPFLAFVRQKCCEAVSEASQHWRRSKPVMFENAEAVGLAIYRKPRSATFTCLPKIID
jgi:hypothetical protein